MTAVKLGSEFLVSSAQDTANQAAPTITGLTNGNFVVTWENPGNSSLAAQVFDPTGAKVGSEFTITEVIDTTHISQTYPTITGLANGGFVVTWTNLTGYLLGDNSYASVNAQIFDATGTKVGSEFLVNSVILSDQRNPSITGLTNGGFVVTWSDTSESHTPGGMIKAQVFDAAGTMVGSEFQANSDKYSGAPHITGLTNGGFVISWADYDAGSRAQVFDASGTKVGSEFLVSTFPEVNQSIVDDLATNTWPLDQSSPTITGLTNGGFVATWHDYVGTELGDASDSSVKAQVYDATGTKVGSEFLVNTFTAGVQKYPAVAGVTNGGFVVTWTDQSGSLGDSDLSIKAQEFDASGTKIGSEFLVNTVTLNEQNASTITGLTNGSFVITWEDNVPGNQATIKAQVFAINHAPVLDLDADNSSGITGTGHQATFIENGAVAIADTDVTVTDVDNTTVALATITLTNPQSSDLLSVNGSLPGGIAASSYDAGTGVLTLSGSATLAAYQTALHQIEFTNSSDSPNTIDRVITVAVSDGFDSSNTATTTIHVTPVNDAPTGTNKTVTTNEDTGHVFTAADFGFSDSDGNALNAVKIATLPGAGSLTDNGVAISAGDFVSKADIDGGKLIFAPAANANGARLCQLHLPGPG